MRAVLVALALVATPTAAFAQTRLPAGYRLPPPLADGPEKAPSREPDDVPRRRFELTLAGTGGLLGCAGNAPRTPGTPDPCAHLEPIGGAAITALLRPIPHVAMGATFSYARFGWDASHGLGRGAGEATWTHLGLAAKGYLFDAGTLEPWIGSTIGGGWLSMNADGGDQLWRNGVAMTGSLGVDVWVSGKLRVGPFGEVAWQPGSGVERCSGGVCLDATGSVARIPDHAFRAGISVTAGLGDELLPSPCRPSYDLGWMLCLTHPTDPSWVAIAMADLDAVLIDHAHCEIKAAMNALSLASRAPSGEMARALGELAEEEVKHFREVLDELGRRGLSLGLPPPDKYAAELRQIAHRTKAQGRSPRETLVDRLLLATLIEARSCERFRLLCDALRARGEATLADFYDALFAAEARHYRVLLDMAIEADGDEARVRERLAVLAREEGELCRSLGEHASVHG
jgi:tRNA-(ms[2]io[6]A)-hydroxylase